MSSMTKAQLIARVAELEAENAALRVRVDKAIAFFKSSQTPARANVKVISARSFRDNSGRYEVRYTMPGKSGVFCKTFASEQAAHDAGY